ncbi:MAG: cysteine desulfurase [Gammaproteobacteria bacterium]|nr:cysteine desulfurase [Gammaproteobacteria bacterium]MDH3467466.1 cysteine desulfurase [Gammaproteobacteria bacterium]
MEANALTANAAAAQLDVERVRGEFPALHQQVHGKPLVYLDSAASAQKPSAVIEAVDHYYRHDHANVHRGVHALSERATNAYEGGREAARRFLNAESVSEIVFVRGATEGINLVAQSYGRPRLGVGDEVLITEMEHHSNIVPWQLLCEQTGATLKWVPIDDRGELLPDEYQRLLSDKTRIVAMTHVSNALGTIVPVHDMVVQAHAAGAVVVIDGAQAVPHVDVDVRAIDADFYTFSGHKVYGPTGIGILYGKHALLEAMPPYQGGGEMIKYVSLERTVYNDLPYKFEAGTPNIAGAVGLGAALQYVKGYGLDAIAGHEHRVLEYARQRAESTPGMKLIGTAAHKASILSFEIDGIHPHDIGTVLDHEGVAVRTGHHCAMPVMQHFGVPATARASLAMYNTQAEIDALFAGIDKVKEWFN